MSEQMMCRAIWLCGAIVVSSLLAFGQTWDKRTPQLEWEGHRLDPAEASGLLAHLCPSGVESIAVGNEKGFRCSHPSLSQQDAQTVPLRHFDLSGLAQPRPVAGLEQISFKWVSTVIYGHFLGPSSNDALLNGSNGETHAEYSGGTLMLTQVGEEWQPVWYKPAIITRFCHKISARTGRDLLLCEEEEGGMGHSYHILYVLDLTQPKPPWDAALLIADSYVLTCREQQEQSIQQIMFGGTGQRGPTFMTVFARHGRKKLSEQETEACGENRLRSRPAVQDYRVDFILRDTPSPAPWSAGAARLFAPR